MGDQQKLKKTRYDYLDIIKAYAIVAVVLSHTMAQSIDFIPNGHIVWPKAIQYGIRLFSEGVPFFLTINGYLLFQKKMLPPKDNLKKVGKIVFLLIIWGIALIIWGKVLSTDDRIFSLPSVLTHFAPVYGDRYIAVLWFLQFLAAAYLVYPALKMIYDINPYVYQYLFGIVAFFSVGMNTLYLINEILAMYMNTECLSQMLVFISRCNPVNADIMWYIFYLMLGGMIYLHQDWLREKRTYRVCLFAIPAPILVGLWISLKNKQAYNAQFNFGTVFMVLFIISVLVFFSGITIKKNAFTKIAMHMGQNTMGIYLIHVFVLFGMNKVWIPKGLVEQISYFLVALLGSYLLAIVFSKIKVGRFLLSFSWKWK